MNDMDNSNAALKITLNNYPESCQLCRIALVESYGDAMSWHSHDFFQIYLVKRGAARHYIGDENVYMMKGEIFIIPPNVVHRIERLYENTQLYCLDFTEEFAAYDFGSSSIKDRLLTFLLMDSTIGMHVYTKAKIV
ncbi:MAG: AraC family ligand binding domain-containing protein, partial [Bacillota bacterium]